MHSSLRRIQSMILRYLYLHTRSLPRAFEIVFWPVMELFVWGFVSVYFRSVAEDKFGFVALSLINAMIFWDVLYRCQQGVSISFVEDIWTQNIINLLVSPLKLWEWAMATFIYAMLKSLLVTLLLGIIAFYLYHFSLISIQNIYLLPLMFNLLLFGWALGLFTSSLVIRWGHAAEALIWGVPFLIQPLSAVFYPLSVLPAPIQLVSCLLPSTYVFEGMRHVINTGTLPTGYIATAFGLNMILFLISGLFFNWMHVQARNTGRLGRLGMD